MDGRDGSLDRHGRQRPGPLRASRRNERRAHLYLDRQRSTSHRHAGTLDPAVDTPSIESLLRAAAAVADAGWAALARWSGAEWRVSHSSTPAFPTLAQLQAALGPPGGDALDGLEAKRGIRVEAGRAIVPLAGLPARLVLGSRPASTLDDRQRLALEAVGVGLAALLSVDSDAVEAQRRQQQSAEGLAQVATIVAATLELPQVLVRVLDQAMNMVGCSTAWIALRTGDEMRVAAVRARGAGSTQVRHGR